MSSRLVYSADATGRHLALIMSSGVKLDDGMFVVSRSAPDKVVATVEAVCALDERFDYRFDTDL